MRVRDLRADDVPLLTAINAANVPAVGEETIDVMAELLGYCSIALGVEVGGVLVGFCYVLPPGAPYRSPNYLWFTERYDSFVYLDRVAFAAEHQGKGYGTGLYHAVEERAGDAAWFLLEVNLKPRNDGSLRFHARQGFREVGQQTVNGKLVSMLAKPLGPSR